MLLSYLVSLLFLRLSDQKIFTITQVDAWQNMSYEIKLLQREEGNQVQKQKS